MWKTSVYLPRVFHIEPYLSDSKIELIFLPPYAPNLNLIERYWRFFKKEILYGKYYQTFALFKQACDDFFAASNSYKEALRSLLTDNFQIIDCAWVPKFEVRLV